MYIHPFVISSLIAKVSLEFEPCLVALCDDHERIAFYSWDCLDQNAETCWTRACTLALSCHDVPISVWDFVFCVLHLVCKAERAWDILPEGEARKATWAKLCSCPTEIGSVEWSSEK